MDQYIFHLSVCDMTVCYSEGWAIWANNNISISWGILAIMIISRYPLNVIECVQQTRF